MPITANNPFKGRQYPGEVIVLCVRWYLRYPLSYEHVSELLSERGVEVDPSCIWRWVQVYAPELNKRCRPYLKPTNKSYRIDETYIKVKGRDKYLYRALDSTGQTIEFLLTAKRDKHAAKRFLVKAIEASGNPMPRVINVDKNPAYPAAVEVLKADGVIPRRVRLRQCKYLNNVIEQDHRTVKKRVWLAKGYGSFQSAWRTLQGIETVNMIRKGTNGCRKKMRLATRFSSVCCSDSLSFKPELKLRQPPRARIALSQNSQQNLLLLSGLRRVGSISITDIAHSNDVADEKTLSGSNFRFSSRRRTALLPYA
jgi:IS6 family transposase